MKKLGIFLLTAIMMPAAFATILLIVPQHVEAQMVNRVLTGSVSNESGPVVGAALAIKGTTIATLTADDGTFTLEGLRPGDVIRVSFLGHKTQDILFSGQWQVTVRLVEDPRLNGEGVATALGYVRERSTLGYAVSSLDAKELTRAGAPNFASALYGKAAGVRVQSSTGGNASAVSVTVRGNGSLSANTQPLLVVDGTPVRNGNANNGDSWDPDHIYSNGIVDINPEDIENVSILKGAAASALYGSDAANGVIIVTTKKGRSGNGIGVEFSATLQGNFVAHMPEVQTVFGPGLPAHMRTNEYQKTHEGMGLFVPGYEWENPILDKGYSFGPGYDGRTIVYWGDKEGKTTPKRAYSSITASPYSDLFRSGLNQTYHIAVSKAGDKANGRFSYTYVDEIPNQYNSAYAKHNFAASGALNLHEKLHVDYSASYLRQAIKNRPRIIGNFSDDATPLNSFDDITLLRHKISNGEKPDHAYTNPTIAKGYYSDIFGNDLTENNSRLIASLAPVWNIVGGLTLRGRIATDLTTQDIERTPTPNSLSSSTDPIILSPTSSLPFPIEKESNLARNSKYDIGYGDVVLLFDQEFSDVFHLTANAGFQGRSERIFNTHFTAPTLYGKNIDDQPENYGLSKTAWFGTVGVSFIQSVYLEGTVRQEWVSALDSKKKSAVYPAVNAGFVFSELFDDNTAYSFGKLHLSYGVVGNASDIYLANLYPHLTPETKREWEVGLENRFFKNRLGVELSYYANKVEDQVLPVALHTSTVWRNSGTISNRGLEIALNARPINTRNFTWDLRFNYAFNRNKVLSLGNDEETITHLTNANKSVAIQSHVGQPMGSIMTYAPKTDERGRPIIGEDGLYELSDELQKVGNALPTGTGGFGTTINAWKLFLDASVDFSVGGSVVSEGYQYTMSRGIHPASLAYRDAWHGGKRYYFDGDGHPVEYNSNIGPNGELIHYNGVPIFGVKAEDGKYIKYTSIVPADQYYSSVYSVDGEKANYSNSVFDNSYMKLRELSIGWHLPKGFTRSVGCNNINLSLFGRNLFYFYKNDSGYDPESAAGTAWYSRVFIGSATTATTRSFGLTLRASF
jgi:TonB-dependent SusC/RagA subfamily outer membrane receptor